MAEPDLKKYEGVMKAEEKLSEAEERFELWRNTIGLFLGPLIGIIIYLLPMPALSEKAHILAAILSWIVIWWICEPVPIPISALLGAVLCVVFGVAAAKMAFAPFADPIIYLFLGSFILAEAMAIHGLDKRFAYAIMSMKFVGNSTARILAVLYGSDAPISKSYAKMMPEGAAALIGAGLLFLLPLNWKEREFTISWKQATKIDWGTLLLFGGGITLGNLMFETKLAEVIGKGLLQLSGATSVWSITFGAIFIAILVSETSSNTASANMVVPVMIALAIAAGVNPIPPDIGATLGASWGFMLPVSTQPNAIV